MEKISNKILYLSFHNSLKKKFGVNKLISKEEIRIKLGRQFLVPKNLRNNAVKELEKMGLIKKQDKNSFLILEGEFDLENNPNKFYKEIGML